MDAMGGQNDLLGTDKACIPSIFIKTSQFLLVKARCQFSPNFNFFEKLRKIEIGPKGR